MNSKRIGQSVKNCITFFLMIDQFIYRLRLTVLRFCMCHGLYVAIVQRFGYRRKYKIRLNIQ